LSGPTSPIDRLKAWCAHAFAVEDPQQGIDPEEEALAEKMARFVVRRRMAVPALMALETGRPFNFIGSQFLTFLSPFLTLIFAPREYERFVRFLEKRRSIEVIIGKILELENEPNG
jgi:hypothetical protein